MGLQTMAAKIEPATMTPLQALCLREKKRRGWTDAQVTDHAGPGLSRTSFIRYRSGTPPLTSMPRNDTLKALAHAFGIPLEEVQRAAVDSVGYSFTSTDLSDDERVVLGALRAVSPQRQKEIARTVLDLTLNLEPPK
jgi:hypothetical protein